LSFGGDCAEGESEVVLLEKVETSEKRRTYMTREARLMSGIILITVPTIQYGGYFLLRSLMSKSSGYMENPLRQNFFRAGHAHAGVIVILSLICEMLADSATLPIPLLATEEKDSGKIAKKELYIFPYGNILGSWQGQRQPRMHSTQSRNLAGATF
jgi:hypothetical protein